MIGHGGGGEMSKWYKPVGKYQFLMARIRAFMIVYQVIISQPKHMLWVLKESQQWDSSFKHKL